MSVIQTQLNFVCFSFSGGPLWESWETDVHHQTHRLLRQKIPASLGRVTSGVSGSINVTVDLSWPECHSAHSLSSELPSSKLNKSFHCFHLSLFLPVFSKVLIYFIFGLFFFFRNIMFCWQAYLLQFWWLLWTCLLVSCHCCLWEVSICTPIIFLL